MSNYPKGYVPWSTLTTNTKIMTVFICEGETQQHVHSGLAILKAGKGYVCPTCGATVTDCTDAPIGQHYFAFARPDLGRKQ